MIASALALLIGMPAHARLIVALESPVCAANSSSVRRFFSRYSDMVMIDLLSHILLVGRCAVKRKPYQWEEKNVAKKGACDGNICRGKIVSVSEAARQAAPVRPLARGRREVRQTMDYVTIIPRASEDFTSMSIFRRGLKPTHHEKVWRTPAGRLCVFLGSCWKRLNDGHTATTRIELDYGN